MKFYNNTNVNNKFFNMNNLKEYFMFLLGSYFLLISIVWPVIFNSVYRQLTLFAPNSMMYKMWLNITVPIYFELYIFNWTNAKEFENNLSLKPEFTDIGPFVFEETHEKINISWSNDESTLSYNQTKTWRFIPEKSADIYANITNLNCFAAYFMFLGNSEWCLMISDSDNEPTDSFIKILSFFAALILVAVLDFLFQTLAFFGNSWQFEHSYIVKRFLDGLLKRYEGLMTTSPAINWLFDGIDQRLLHYINLLRNVTYIPIPFEKFAWFYDRNGSSEFEGRFEMKTGATNIYEMGNLVKWNNMNQTEYYPGECGKIKGLAGELIPPVNKFQKNLIFFSSDLCSYMNLNYAGSIEMNEITVNVYEGDEDTFNYDEYHLENRCFCVNQCPPRGIRNVSLCKFGSPAFISFPHFFRASPYYTQAIHGMTPNESLHKFFIKLEPKTGVPLEIQAGLQVNFLLESFEWSDIYRDKPKIYIPLIWFKQRAKIPHELLLLLRIFLFALNYGDIVLFVLAEICFSVGFLLLTFKKNLIFQMNKIV